MNPLVRSSLAPARPAMGRAQPSRARSMASARLCGRTTVRAAATSPSAATAAAASLSASHSSSLLGGAGAAALRAAGAAATAPTPCRGGALITRALFTGIVQGTAEVAAITKRDEFQRMTIAFPPGATDAVQIGASVSINGTCLTVTDIDADKLSFDLIVETLRATNLGKLEVGSICNFERSAKMGDEVGGHHVSGHVHTVATVSRLEDTGDNRKVTLSLDPSWIKYVLPKGFIAVDGCSLTVGEVGDDWFTVYLIPETIRQTVFRAKGEGSGMNIEIEQQTQAIVDTVERVVEKKMAEIAGKM